MAIYVARTEVYDDGREAVFIRCYWDEGSNRAVTREEARAGSSAGHDVEVPDDHCFSLREHGWTVSREDLWLCPTHARECPG